MRKFWGSQTALAKKHAVFGEATQVRPLTSMARIGRKMPWDAGGQERPQYLALSAVRPFPNGK